MYVSDNKVMLGDLMPHLSVAKLVISIFVHDPLGFDDVYCGYPLRDIVPDDLLHCHVIDISPSGDGTLRIAVRS